MSNLTNKYSIEEKLDLTVMAVAELIDTAKHNKQVDDENYQHVQDMKKAFKELQDTVTRLTNTYLVVQDDLTALAARLERLEAAQLAELGDGK
jgi:predicted  nucleic acid-binding Zn-ribbon protein